MWTVFPISPMSFESFKAYAVKLETDNKLYTVLVYTKRVGWRGQTVGWTSSPRLSTTTAE